MSEVDLDEFPSVMKVVDLLQSLPPTSVSCETTFSRMKIIKTYLRNRISEATLNTLMTINIETLQVGEFSVDPAIDRWIVSIFLPIV